MGKMTPVVTILQGAVQGVQGCDLDGNTIYEFLGIPYAKPPVGELRFKEPQPPSSWVGVKDVTSDGSACYHYNELTKQFEGSEDCLYLNVFTRELPQDHYNLKPVMVWIHGGGFTGGSNSSKMYGPEFLLSKDIVLVSINYRLGFLGFLRFKDTTFNISGNMGFKDQVQALHWVKDNIQQFNGDPDNITLFGESAGAAAVHYHVLSPLSRSLFHKAILQSGAALNPWADECDHSTVQIAKMIDSSIRTEKDAYNILKNLTMEELYGLQVKFLETIEPGAIRPIGLVIEPEKKKSAFISKRPIDIISSGDYKKVPMIFGYTNREGMLFNALRKRKGDNRKLIPDYFIPHNVNFKANREVRWKYINQLQNLYFSGPSQEDNDDLILGDSWFVAGIIGSVKNHSQTSPYPVFLYKLSLETQLNFTKVVFNATNYFGCSHADDLGYLFKTFATPEIPPGSQEDVHLRRILRLWTNFARSGNPTPDGEKFNTNWKPVRPRQLNTLHIKEELKLEVNPEVKRIDLWRRIYHEATGTSKYL